MWKNANKSPTLFGFGLSHPELKTKGILSPPFWGGFRRGCKYIVFVVGLLLSACISDEVAIPEEILQEKKMVEVMTDMQLLESASQKGLIKTDSISGNAKAMQHYAAIFKFYNTTEKQFRESHDFYQEHPKLLEEIYDKVLIELSKQQAELKKVRK